MVVGSASGAKSASTQPLNVVRSVDAGACEPDQRQQQPGQANEHGESQRAAWAPRRPRPRPPASTRRPAAAAASDRSRSRTAHRQRPFGSHSRAPPSTAAKNAPMAPDAAAGGEIDLDAGFVQRAEHAGVVGARRTGAGQHDRGAKPRRILAIRRVRSNHEWQCSGSGYSSWIVISFTSSNRRLPFGAAIVTSSPSSLPSRPRPIGEAVEIRPCSTSASSGMTS